MSRPPITLWFDFISPFGWFASLRIDEIAARHAREVQWRPLLLGVTVLKVMGLKPVMDTPLKGPYAARQIARYARRHGLRVARDPAVPPMNPLPCARLFAWLRVHDAAHAKTFARAALHAYWAEGRALDEAATLRVVALRAGVPPDSIERGLADPAAASMLRTEVEAALAAGAFGSPFVIVDGEPFFGVDTLEQVDEWLALGGW